MARLLEHHALGFFREEKIPVPRFQVVSTAKEASEAAAGLGGSVVIKALIPVGGRGKAGAIKMAKSPSEAIGQAEGLAGRTILNFPVEELLVSETVNIAREFFVSITFDSMSRRPVLLFSALGGVDVETILDRDPAQLSQFPIKLSQGLGLSQARQVLDAAGLTEKTIEEGAELLCGLYRIFCRLDAETVEVNPLVLTQDQRLLALSGVIVADNQALFRHAELEGMAQPDRTNGWRPLTALEKDMRAIDAIDSGSAIRFNEFSDGDIAFMITGGGAGLLAFDAITKLGGHPATTFDITPGRVEEKMYRATVAILSRPGLKGFIAGGNITNFIPIDVKVRGVVRALKELDIDATKFPVVFRFAGPGVEAARELASTVPGIQFYDAATSLEDAVARIVELTKSR